MSISKVSRQFFLFENASLELDDIPVKRPWVHDFNKERAERSGFHHVYHQSQLFDQFHEYLRMSQGTFDFLLAKVEVRLTKATTNYRQPIAPDQRLFIKLT